MTPLQLPAGGTRLNLSGQAFQDPDDKRTPLMVAAEGGHTEIVRTILGRAPNTAADYVNAMGGMALMLAAQHHHADIVRLLGDHGANARLVYQRLWATTPLRCAVVATHPGNSPRGPDPGGARQVATVRALLRLGECTLPSPPPSTQHPLGRLPPPYSLASKAPLF